MPVIFTLSPLQIICFSVTGFFFSGSLIMSGLLVCRYFCCFLTCSSRFSNSFSVPVFCFIALSLNSSSFFLISLVFSFSARASFISRIVFSILRLAFLRSSSASSFAFSIISFLNFLIESNSSEYFSTISSSFFSDILILSLFRSQYRLSLTTSLRCLSKSICSLPTFFCASSRIFSGSPILRAISKAKELPGLPISRRNNGSIR
ncbi:hypothetical protein ES705_29759 [subsurface metagenome]